MERLGELRELLRDGMADENGLRRVLYGLHAVVSLHFAKEEEVYLPILEARLTPHEADTMFAAMEAAAHEIKSHVAH